MSCHSDQTVSFARVRSLGKFLGREDSHVTQVAVDATRPRRGRLVANFLAKIRQDFVRFRLYRHRSLHVNSIKFVEIHKNFLGLVLGCIEAKFCNQILVGISYLFEKKIEKRDMERN